MCQHRKLELLKSDLSLDKSKVMCFAQFLLIQKYTSYEFILLFV